MAVLAAIGVSHRALAANPTVALANNNSLTTASGLTYTISNCAYALSGVSQSGCGPAGAELETSGTGRSAIMEVLDSSPGTNLLSLAGSGAPTFSDITFNLTITSSTPGIALTSFTDTLAGSGASAAAGEVSAAVSSNLTNPNFNLTTNLTNLTDTASFAAFNTATSSPSLYLSVDLKVSTQSAAGNQGVISLTSVTYQAPEPASIALFGTALTGMVVVRRRSKRSARQKRVAV